MREKNIYDVAAALWVARKWDLDRSKVGAVTFEVLSDDCPTCGYNDPAIEFWYDGISARLSLGNVSPGQFIQECVELLAEVGT